MTSIRIKPFRRLTATEDKAIIHSVLMRVGNGIKRELQAGMAGGHSGRIYGSHQASAPGEYPANRSGRLSGSFEVTATALQVRVGTNVPYAGYLAHGTSKMAKRKFIREAIDKVVPKELSNVRFERFKQG